MNIPQNGHYMDRWSDYPAFRRWMVATRKLVGLTQERLGEMVGLSKVSIRKIELGQTRAPKYETVRSIIAALENPDVTTAGKLALPPRYQHGGERLGEVQLMPVYRWGTRGDPRVEEARPLPESKEFPAGGASVVGTRGFGVIVHGDGLAAFGIHDRDVVWCNPDEPLHANMPVVTMRDGLQVDVDSSNGAVVGPVVWVTPSGHPPRRP